MKIRLPRFGSLILYAYICVLKLITYLKRITMTTLLKGINDKLRKAIQTYVESNKTLDRSFQVTNVDFHGKSYVGFAGIDDAQFKVDEVWEAGNFILKITKIVDLDGECFLTLEEVS